MFLIHLLISRSHTHYTICAHEPSPQSTYCKLCYLFVCCDFVPRKFFQLRVLHHHLATLAREHRAVRAQNDELRDALNPKRRSELHPVVVRMHRVQISRLHHLGAPHVHDQDHVHTCSVQDMEDMRWEK